MFDIVIHRLIELPATAGAGTLELLLKELGMLYKFHGKILLDELEYLLHVPDANLFSNKCCKKLPHEYSFLTSFQI